MPPPPPNLLQLTANQLRAQVAEATNANTTLQFYDTLINGFVRSPQVKTAQDTFPQLDTSGWETAHTHLFASTFDLEELEFLWQFYRQCDKLINRHWQQYSICARLDAAQVLTDQGRLAELNQTHCCRQLCCYMTWSYASLCKSVWCFGAGHSQWCSLLERLGRRFSIDQHNLILCEYDWSKFCFDWLDYMRQFRCNFTWRLPSQSDDVRKKEGSTASLTKYNYNNRSNSYHTIQLGNNTLAEECCASILQQIQLFVFAIDELYETNSQTWLTQYELRTKQQC
jgi:hypothetical protein